jgi:DnaJ family protein C protein 28
MLEAQRAMEYKDWRKSPDKHPADSEQEPPKVRKYYGKKFEDYISEQIREAEARGEFDNLQGAGKPLNLDSNVYAGDKAMGYSLLKSQGFAPKEIELAKEIRTEHEHAEAKIARLRHRSRTLRSRRVPPFATEKRAFNAAVERAAAEYEKTLRDLNRKIVTLNLMTPPVMHQRLFDVKKLVQNFRESCPLFD